MADIANLSPDKKLMMQQRPRSIQRQQMQPLQPIMSNGISGRNDQSCLEHIRRIRRNLPSQQNPRNRNNDDSLSGGNYLSALPTHGVNKSKIENYKRIKMEEQQARQQLISQPGEIDSVQPSHRRMVSNANYKYKPSANALAQYSPLRNMGGIPVAYSQDANIISSDELKGLREII